jgi:hypothetical protein
MPATAYIAFIGIVGSVLLAGVTYWFTKQRERDAELRKEKLEHYKDFVASLSGIISGEATPEGRRVFARASNKLMLVAPQSVIEALRAFQQQIKVSNPNQNIDRHDELMSRLFYEMRRDLGISADDQRSFKVGLWAAGVPSATMENIDR